MAKDVSKAQTRQARRLERALDEIIKIHDDGKGNENTMTLLDMLREEINRRQSL